jgi:hypothetical protein
MFCIQLAVNEPNLAASPAKFTLCSHRARQQPTQGRLILYLARELLTIAGQSTAAGDHRFISDTAN